MVRANRKGKGNVVGSKSRIKEEISPEEIEKRAKVVQHELSEKFMGEKRSYKIRKPALVADSIKSLRKDRAGDMRKLVGFLMENYEKEMIKQQYQINKYFEDMTKCNFQQQMLTNSHSDIVEEMNVLFERHLENIDSQFQHFFHIIKKDFDSSVQSIFKVKKRKVFELTKILKDMERRESRKRKEMEVNFMSNSDVLVKRNSKMFEVMKIGMGKIVKDVSKQYDDLMKSESRRVGNLFSQYRVIKKDDIKTKGEITELLENLKKTREKNNEWKAKHLNNLKNFQKRNKLLQNEIFQVKVQYQVLKKNMSKFMKSEEKRLLRLVKLANSSRKCLQARAELSCRILHRNNMIEPLETEKEREMMLKSDKFNYKEKKRLNKREREEKTKDWNVMKRFYKKVNTVSMTNEGLTRERQILVKKNKDLRKKLTVYINGISVNPQILREKNSLLMQQKINLNPRMPGGMKIKNIML